MKHKCPRQVCSYEWDSRVKHPKQCPKCKRYIPLIELQNAAEKGKEETTQ